MNWLQQSQDLLVIHEDVAAFDIAMKEVLPMAIVQAIK